MGPFRIVLLSDGLVFIMTDRYAVIGNPVAPEAVLAALRELGRKFA